MTPHARRPAATRRAAQRRARPPGPSVGHQAASENPEALPPEWRTFFESGERCRAGRHRARGHEDPLVGARAERHDQQGGACHQRDRDGDERGAPAGERGLGRGRPAEQVGNGDDGGHHSGCQAKRRLTDVEAIEERTPGSRRHAHGETADCTADGGESHR